MAPQPGSFPREVSRAGERSACPGTPPTALCGPRPWECGTQPSQRRPLHQQAVQERGSPSVGPSVPLPLFDGSRRVARQHVPVTWRLRCPGPGLPHRTWSTKPHLPPRAMTLPALPPAPHTHDTTAAQQSVGGTQVDETWYTAWAQACGPCVWARGGLPVRPIMPRAPSTMSPLPQGSRAPGQVPLPPPLLVRARTHTRRHTDPPPPPASLQGRMGLGFGER